MTPDIKTSRRGIASLEFVLGLPFLLLAAAVVFAFASASLSATRAAVLARHDAWQGRGPVGTERTFEVVAGEPADLTNRVATERFQVSAALRLVGTSAESKNSVLAGTWDHRDVPFKDPQSAFTPHVELIEKLFTAAAEGSVAALRLPGELAGFAEAGDPGSNQEVPNQLALTSHSTGKPDGQPPQSKKDKEFPVDTLDKTPGSDSSASQLSKQSGELTAKLGSVKSGSLGEISSLSHAASEGPAAILAVGREIFDGADAALNPLVKLTGALDDLFGKQGDGDGNIVTDIVDKAEDLAAQAFKEIVGLFNKDAKKDIEKLVSIVDQLKELKKLGLPFGKLAEAARDHDWEAPDEFSTGKNSIYQHLESISGDWK